MVEADPYQGISLALISEKKYGFTGRLHFLQFLYIWGKMRKDISGTLRNGL